MRWSDNEIDVLKEKYQLLTYKEIQNKFLVNRRLKAIEKKARELGLRKNISWTKKEEELLRIYWKTGSMSELMDKFSGRTYSSLCQKARELNIKCEIRRNSNGDLRFLDSLSRDSCYWWGFIMADGHLSCRGELTICLHKKDGNHLDKLANILGSNVRYRDKFAIMTCQTRDIGLKWLDILKISKPKTYYPPNLDVFFNCEWFIEFVVGLIDGDGCIWLSNKQWKTPYPNISIELHGNWMSMLKDIEFKVRELLGIRGKVKLTSRGTSLLFWGGKDNLKPLYEISKTVPSLKRKWKRLKYLD